MRPTDFFNSKMAEWGLPTRVVAEENGQIVRWENPVWFDEGPAPRGGYLDVDYNNRGICFYFPDLYSRDFITYASQNKGNPHKRYQSIRLIEPKGDMKYQNPSDIERKIPQRGTYPFLPPLVMNAYRDQAKIHNLVILEGPAKALKADLEGIYCIGLQGKDNFTDTTTKKFHQEITDIIKACKVENLIYLHDSDALDVKVEPMKDLAGRLVSFYQSVKRFKARSLEMIKKEGLQVYYLHGKQGTPKGIDDLLVQLHDEKRDILEDLNKLERASRYFTGFKLHEKTALKKLHEHFMLHSVEIFYEKFLVDEAPYDEFVYQGDTYQCNEENDEVELVRSKWSHRYFSVGPDFYLLERNQDPRSGQIDVVRTPWSKGQIIQRHIKTVKEDMKCPGIFDQIRYYSKFFFEPDNFNYRPEHHIPGNDFAHLNLYQDTGWRVHLNGTPADHYAAQCPNILRFIRHITQEDEKHEEILDWLRLLFERPKQKLHVLCLVSEANETGKSTFGFLVKEIFRSNCIILGNAEIESQFNAVYADKVVMIVDEAHISDYTKEKIKMLSTTPKLTMNQKHIQGQEIDYHGHIILITNKELEFMKILPSDNRFFVLRVPNFQESAYRLDLPEGQLAIDLIRPEVEAFLHYLMHRPMKYPKPEGRFWIPFSAVRTRALQRVVEYSMSDLDLEFNDLMRRILDVAEGEVVYMELERIVASLNERREKKHESGDVLRFLRKRFPGIKTQAPSSYKLFVAFNEETGEVIEHQKNPCRPYRFDRKELETQINKFNNETE